tara:strand:+ start:1103 stop:2101 length:999 start_codon:yes stop_codon:yes gene_type:complete
MAAKYLSLPLATVVDSGTQTVVQTGTSEALSSGTNTTVGTGTVITLVGGQFQTIGIIAGDIVYNTTQGNSATVSGPPNSETSLNITGNTIDENDVFLIVRTNVVYDSNAFATTLVAVGDTVTNTVTNATATVTALNSNNAAVPLAGSALTLSADIFANAAANFNDTFSISVVDPAGADSSILFDSGQNFSTTVSPGDMVYNTTDNVSARVVSVDSNFRLTLSGSIMATGDTFNILDEVTYDEQLVSLSELVMVQRTTAYTTTIYYGAGAGNDTIVITHTDQGSVNLVQDAVQLAMQDAFSVPGSIPKPSTQEVPIGLNASGHRVLINSIAIS